MNHYWYLVVFGFYGLGLDNEDLGRVPGVNDAGLVLWRLRPCVHLTSCRNKFAAILCTNKAYSVSWMGLKTTRILNCTTDQNCMFPLLVLVTKSSLTKLLKTVKQKYTSVEMVTYSAELIRDTIASNRSLPMAASQ